MTRVSWTQRCFSQILVYSLNFSLVSFTCPRFNEESYTRPAVVLQVKDTVGSMVHVRYSTTRSPNQRKIPRAVPYHSNALLIEQPVPPVIREVFSRLHKQDTAVENVSPIFCKNLGINIARLKGLTVK